MAKLYLPPKSVCQDTELIIVAFLHMSQASRFPGGWYRYVLANLSSRSISNTSMSHDVFQSHMILTSKTTEPFPCSFRNQPPFSPAGHMTEHSGTLIRSSQRFCDSLPTFSDLIDHEWLESSAHSPAVLLTGH